MYLLKAHNRAIRPCHPSHSMPLALILPRLSGLLAATEAVLSCLRYFLFPLESTRFPHRVYSSCAVSCASSPLLRPRRSRLRSRHRSHPRHRSHLRNCSRFVCVWGGGGIYLIAHNCAIRPCHPSHSVPLALILPRGVCVCVCVCIY